jgi:hypothetical protein
MPQRPRAQRRRQARLWGLGTWQQARRRDEQRRARPRAAMRLCSNAVVLFCASRAHSRGILVLTPYLEQRRRAGMERGAAITNGDNNKGGLFPRTEVACGGKPFGQPSAGRLSGNGFVVMIVAGCGVGRVTCVISVEARAPVDSSTSMAARGSPASARESAGGQRGRGGRDETRRDDAGV